MVFKPVPVEDIRANKITFEDFIIRCFDRMDMVLPDCVKDNNYQIIDAKLRFINGVSHFFNSEDKEFQKRLAQIFSKLEGKSIWDYGYYKELINWVSLLSLKFQHMKVIGPIESTVDMGGVDNDQSCPKTPPHP